MKRLQMPNFGDMQYLMLAKPDQTHHRLRRAPPLSRVGVPYAGGEPGAWRLSECLRSQITINIS